MKKLIKMLDHPTVRTFEISSTFVGIVSYAGTFVDQNIIPDIIKVGEVVMYVGIFVHVLVFFFMVLPSQFSDWDKWKKFDPNVKASYVFLPRLTMGVLWSFLGRNFVAIFLISLVEIFPETFKYENLQELNYLGITLYFSAAAIIMSWYLTSFRDVGEK